MAIPLISAGAAKVNFQSFAIPAPSFKYAALEINVGELCVIVLNDASVVGTADNPLELNALSEEVTPPN